MLLTISGGACTPECFECEMVRGRAESPLYPTSPSLDSRHGPKRRDGFRACGLRARGPSREGGLWEANEAGGEHCVPGLALALLASSSGILEGSAIQKAFSGECRRPV